MSAEALAVAYELIRPREVITRNDVALALDAFAARAVAAEREENEWLRRLLRWCRLRLKHPSYQTWLDKYLAAGPSPAPTDEPSVVHSDT